MKVGVFPALKRKQQQPINKKIYSDSSNFPVSVFYALQH